MNFNKIITGDDVCEIEELISHLMWEQDNAESAGNTKAANSIDIKIDRLYSRLDELQN